jgi:hypothetical protein
MIKRPPVASPLRRLVFGAASVGFFALSPAQAQLVLPGAPAAGPAGSSGAAQGGGLAAPPPVRVAPRPSAPKTTGETSVLGKTLYFNGSKGKLVIEKAGSGLQATLIAVGDKISKPNDTCGLDLGGGKPLDMIPTGRPAGAPRYEIRIPACLITVDLLDGAALVGSPDQACSFPEGDCRVSATGLWGPQPASLEAQSAAIEKDRGRADKIVRESYKALYARTKDKNETKKIAAEQADFTSAREIVCRDYAREPAHGFCATRFTELRATDLVERVSKLDGREFVPETNRPRPKPPVDAEMAAAPPPVAAAPPPQRQTPSIWPFNLFR